MQKTVTPALVNSNQATRVQEAINILKNAIERKTTLSVEAIRQGKDRRFVNNVARQIIANPKNVLPTKVIAEFNQHYTKFARGGVKKKFNTKKNTASAPIQTPATIKIEFHNNLPIPVAQRGRKATGSKYQFEKIKKGQTAVYEVTSKKQELNIRQSATTYAKRKNIKLITAKIDNNRIGVWNITKAEAKLRRK